MQKHMTDTPKTVSFALGEHDRSFISEMVEKGRFGNRTEVVRAGLRLLQDYEINQKIQRLRALITEGDNDIKQGRFTESKSAADLFKDITE